ncbi:transmembrane channel-like protein 7 isoform X1 [Phycodurus eques]|uniref:transmembrane channel-like protein 7 isoform X1 n=1 Tax=Phycodurus eques TaxID=693459 RepID=UPI002ACEBDF0|nr:transmembrane channel-like protein 7 isoform X1 [Phycodurus eques]XP_061536444.1 transmembrane channel-like protein 7 isoform X1 [Phycodurus eques]
MENNVNFTRLLSESGCSTLSSDSCEYYHTEIFDQLPSIQFFWPERSRQDASEVDEELGHLSRGPRDKISTQPLRSLTMCIQGKRHARNRKKMQTSNIGFLESWRQSQSTNTKRVWSKLGGAISGLLPWQHTLHVIEGRFGVGVNAYFVFLRYLVYLNLIHCALIWVFILGPTTFYGSDNKNGPLKFGGNDSVLDFFLGSGYLDRSPVFYGFYTRGSLNYPCLNTPMLYFSGILAILLLSVIIEIRRTTVGYKHTWMLGKRSRMNVSYKIFCGWDFTIQDADAATLKRSFLRNDLKLYLEEQRFSQYEARRTMWQWVRLHLLRITFNLLVLSLLGGAFYLIYFATEKSQSIRKISNHYWLVSLLLQYLPPITITFVNLFLPHIFRKISSFEDYSFTMQVNITLVRSIFLKLASLGIYLFFVFTTTHEQCTENQFGSELYKLCIFNFLATVCNAFLVNYPRKLVQEKFRSSLLAKLLGKQHFLVPFNVLDLVYGQTVSWVGVYFCPLLPLIGTITLTATFYIKKFTVLRCCVAEQRMFRASNSFVLFHFMLLLGLVMAATTLGFTLFQEQTPLDAKIFFQYSPCGPFGNGQSVLNVAGVCVESLPSLAKTIIRYMTSKAFALSLILAEIIVLTSYVSRGRANQKTIERLKDMLVMSSSDKRFLVKKHATMVRHRNISSVHARRMPSQST